MLWDFAIDVQTPNMLAMGVGMLATIGWQTTCISSQTSHFESWDISTTVGY